MEATSRFSFVAAGILPVIRGSVEEKVERNGRNGGEWEGREERKSGREGRESGKRYVEGRDEQKVTSLPSACTV